MTVHVEIEGPYTLQSGALIGTPTLLDLQTTGAALSWSLGSTYQLSDQTTLGLRYQSENEFDSDGSIRITIPGLGASRYDTKVGLTWARSVGAGIQHKLDSRQRIGIDFEWEDWSDAFDNAYLNLSNPSDPVFQVLAPTVAEILPLRWKDSIIVSLGYERDLNATQTVRCGYRYQNNPIPESTTTTYLQTTLEHHFSLGYGCQWSGWTLDSAYQYAYAPKVHTGTSAVVGGDFSNATITTQTHMVFFGASHRF